MAREQTNEAEENSALKTKATDGTLAPDTDGAKAAVESARKGEQGAPQPGDRPTVSDYEIVNHYFDLACDRLGLPDDVREVMRTSYREISVQIPVRMTDGKMQVFSGYRVQHNGARGPVQGRRSLPPRGRPRRGARARDADDLEDRARQHPVRRREGRRQLPRRPSSTTDERQAISRSFMGKVEKILGPNRDIMAPDLNTNAQIDGLDDGRVRQAPRPHAGDRDRQADRARGLLRARGGRRPRPHLPASARRLRSSASARPTRPASSRASATSATTRRASCTSSA